MNITLLNKDVQTKPTKTGKTYQLIEVGFKNNTFGGKIEGFKVTQYMKGFKGIAEANVGDTLEVEVVKGDSGFNEWVSVQKAASSAVPQVNMPGVRQEGGSPKSVPQRTWQGESPEERAKRQVYIVRQSSISAAIAALSVGAKAPLKAEDVKVLAKQFEAFVFDNTNATGFDDVPDIDPSFNTDPQID